MIIKIFFKQMPISRQADFMKKKGVSLGTRKKGARLAYLYMVNNLFAEILYENDNPGMNVEALVVLDGLNKLNHYLENDLRSSQH